MSFDKWYKSWWNTPEANEMGLREEFLKCWNVAFESAQEEQQVEKDLIEENELLRAVYNDSRAVMFCHEHVLSKPIRESLGCAIGCVERFDEEAIESAVDWGNENE